MGTVTESFGCKVFNDTVMKARLPKDTYEAMQTAIKAFQFVCYSLGIVAYALAIWHYTH